jgi:hypothetical protein
LNKEYIKVVIALDISKISHLKKVLDLTIEIDDVITTVVNKEYGLTLNQITSLSFSSDSVNVEFEISLKDDADSIGSCIEEVKRRLKSLVIDNTPED